MVELWTVSFKNISFNYLLNYRILCGAIKNWGSWFVAVRVAAITSFETVWEKISIGFRIAGYSKGSKIYGKNYLMTKNA